MSVAIKRIKAFKKWYEDKPDPDDMDSDDDRLGAAGDPEDEG